MKYIILFTLMTLVSCGSEQAVESQNLGALTTANLESKWSSTASFPLTVSLSDQFTTDEQNAIDESSDEWTLSVGSTVDFINDSGTNTAEKSYSSLSQYNDGEFGVYKLNSWPSSLGGTALAVTQIFGTRVSSGGRSYIRIEHADILVNYDNFSFKGLTSGAGYDLKTVILHEYGHFLGLYHDSSSKSLSVMYPSINSMDLNQEPKLNDVNNIEAKYSLNGSIASLTASNNGRSEALNVKYEKVRLIHELRADGEELMRINVID